MDIDINFDSKKLLDYKHDYDFDLGRVLYFIAERQRIFVKKEVLGLPAPWTDDPIFSEYRFCNVERRDDRVSRGIIKAIIEPYADHPDLWLMLTLARWINWVPTLYYLIGCDSWFGKPGFSLEGIAEDMLQYQLAGNKVYTGAYMIKAESDPASEFFGGKRTKHEFILCKVIKGLMDDRDKIEAILADPSTGIQRVTEMFHGYLNFGGFMSYEIATDLTYTRYLKDAHDRYTWSNLGPGANRGMNRLRGEAKLEKSNTQEQWVEYSRKVLEGVLKAYDEGVIPNSLIPREYLDMRMVESAHCETDKYLRVLTGEGRPRAKFKSHTYSIDGSEEQIKVKESTSNSLADL